MLDWLIIGGGVHGTHLSLALKQRHGEGAVRVLDPEPAPLARWWRCVQNTGMRYLRSPVVHHLDLDPFSLMRFADRGGYTKRDFAPPYDRPSVALFRAHTEQTIAEHRLDALRLTGRATAISLREDRVQVETDHGPLVSKRILLALGAGDNLDYPAWAAHLIGARRGVQHLFERGFAVESLADTRRVAVIGGGISAAQAALLLQRRGHAVTHIMRHAPRIHQFDSDPGWVGPKYMRGYAANTDTTKRRSLIRDARHRGSMPKDVYDEHRRALNEGAFSLLVNEVTDARVIPDGGFGLLIGDQWHAFDAVLFATGFRAGRPGGPLVDALATQAKLPCAACGFPLVTPHLHWHERVVVAGPLAELELGPVARNIVGARRAAERIVA